MLGAKKIISNCGEHDDQTGDKLGLGAAHKVWKQHIENDLYSQKRDWNEELAGECS